MTINLVETNEIKGDISFYKWILWPGDLKYRVHKDVTQIINFFISKECSNDKGEAKRSSLFSHLNPGTHFNQYVIDCSVLYTTKKFCLKGYTSSN